MMKNEEKKIISGRTAYNIIEFLTRKKKKKTQIFTIFDDKYLKTFFLNLSQITTLTLKKNIVNNYFCLSHTTFLKPNKNHFVLLVKFKKMYNKTSFL